MITYSTLRAYIQRQKVMDDTEEENALDRGCERGQCYSAKTCSADCSGLQHPQKYSHSDWDGLDRRIPDVQHKKEKPICDAVRS